MPPIDKLSNETKQALEREFIQQLLNIFSSPGTIAGAVAYTTNNDPDQKGALARLRHDVTPEDVLRMFEDREQRAFTTEGDKKGDRKRSSITDLFYGGLAINPHWDRNVDCLGARPELSERECIIFDGALYVARMQALSNIEQNLHLSREMTNQANQYLISFAQHLLNANSGMKLADPLAYDLNQVFLKRLQQALAERPEIAPPRINISQPIPIITVTPSPPTERDIKNEIKALLAEHLEKLKNAKNKDYAHAESLYSKLKEIAGKKDARGAILKEMKSEITEAERHKGKIDAQIAAMEQAYNDIKGDTNVSMATKQAYVTLLHNLKSISQDASLDHKQRLDRVNSLVRENSHLRRVGFKSGADVRLYHKEEPVSSTPGGPAATSKRRSNPG